MVIKFILWLSGYMVISFVSFSQTGNNYTAKYDSILRSSLLIQLKADSLQDELDIILAKYDTTAVFRQSVDGLKRGIFFLQQDANMGYRKANEIEKVFLYNYLKAKRTLDSLDNAKADSLREITLVGDFLNFVHTKNVFNEKHFEKLTMLSEQEQELTRLIASGDAEAHYLSRNIFDNSNFNLSKKELKAGMRKLKMYGELNKEKFQVYTACIHYAKEQCRNKSKLKDGGNIEIQARDQYKRARISEEGIFKLKNNENSYKKYLETIVLMNESLRLFEKTFVIYLDNEKVTPVSGKNEKEARLLFNEFSILPSCPYSEEKPIPLDAPLPGGVIYKIQLGVFSSPVLQNKFAGVFPVNGELLEDIDAVRYYTGVFSKFEDAEKALVQVYSYGYTGAYIVVFFNGTRISLNKAALYQEDKKEIKLTEVPDLTRDETEYPLVSFNIQVGAYKDGIPLYLLDKLKKGIGDKKIIQNKNKEGIIVYSIEKFNNFDEAQNMKEALEKSGLSGIFVIAFENGVRIPIKDAIQLQQNFVK